MFAAISQKYHTPIVAIWKICILVMIFATTHTFTTLLLLSVAARLYESLWVCVCVIILRYKAAHTERPFSVWYPNPGVGGYLLCVALSEGHRIGLTFSSHCPGYWILLFLHRAIIAKIARSPSGIAAHVSYGVAPAAV